LKTFVDAIDLHQRVNCICLLVAEPVITTFSCSVLSPQRRLYPQYVGCFTTNHNDNDYSTDDANYVDDIDDILSQSSMSPDPPSDISLQGSSRNSNVNGGYDDNDDITSSYLSTMSTIPYLVPVTSSHRTMSSNLVFCCPAPSPYNSNADSCDGNDSDGEGGHTSPQWTMSPDLPSDDDVNYVDDVTSHPSPTG